MPETVSRLASLSPEKRKLLERLLQGKKAPPQAAGPDVLSFRPGGTPQESKAQYRQFYDTVSRQLAASGYGDLSFFLNYGYVANGSPQFAAVPLPEHALNRNSIKLVLELIGECGLNGRDALDIGCGRGGTIYVMNRFYQPRSSTGLDLSREALAFCRRVHHYPGVEFLQGDAEKLPFGTARFDVVTNVESSHSYPDLAAFLEEVFRVLRPGGWFLYTDSVRSEEWPARVAVLKHLGFELIRDRDITGNVLLSCDETAGRRRGAFGQEQGILDDFLAVPGSSVYEDMRSGSSMYRIWTLRR